MACYSLNAGLSQFAVMPAIQKVNYQTNNQPNKKPVPVGMTFLGHEVKATDQAKDRYQGKISFK